MLLGLIMIPLIGAFTLTLIKNEKLIKKFSLVISLINFIISIILWIKFNNQVFGWQFIEEWANIGFCKIHLGIDGISLPFIILTTFIIPICILVSWSSIKEGINRYFILLLILESILITVFLVLDLLLFYIAFESSLIPMFLIIGIWGSRERKVHAAMMFFLYTLLGSLFMLFAILVIYSAIGTTDFEILSLTEISKIRQNILWLGIFLSLAVKTPMIPFHLWLPEAHVEAPVAGSVILAGILLKLATYGFLRVSLPILPEASNYFIPLIYTMATIGIIYSSFTTLRQIDLKKIIAYSSIGHMSIGILGIFSNTIQGIEGAILLSIAHGIVSPALFICVGILYDRYHSRLIKYYRGLVISMPLFAIYFFIFTLANMATPLTANFIGEFLTFTGSFKINPVLVAISATSMILVAGYSIWLYNRICFGNESIYLIKAKDLTRREFFLLLPLVFLTFLFGVFPNILLDPIHYSVSFLLYNNYENILYASLSPIMVLRSNYSSKKSFMNLNKEESVELVETVGNTIADGTLAFTTVATGVIAYNVPTTSTKL
jgi:NADH-ubiquinone oxidoreductase chain 4